MSEELPQGWASAPLSQIAEINPRHPKAPDDAMPVTFVPMAGLSASKPEFQFTEERPLAEVRKGFTHFAEGDVLFAKITPCMENGKGAVARGLRNKLGCGTTEVHVIRPLANISPEYIYRFLAQNRVRRAAKENFTGTAGQARVPTSFIEELETPLAPLAEQRRIVAKLEKLLGQVDACQQRLAKIPVLLKRFRQAVLAAACSGRLTADWREEHGGISGTASHSNPSRNNYDLSPDVELEWLPDEWRWIPIGNLSDFQQGMQIAKNTRLKESGAGRLPILRTFNYANGFSEDVEYVELADETLIAEADDIILSRTGTIDKVRTGFRGVFHNNSFRLNYDHSLLAREYLIYWLEGPSVQNFIKAVSGRSAQPDLTHKAFGPFPLPPLPEQQEIVRRVTSLFALADQLEARLAAVQRQVDALTPSLLARAFSGQLVPQDPTDESASELLKRIKRQEEQRHLRLPHRE